MSAIYPYPESAWPEIEQHVRAGLAVTEPELVRKYAHDVCEMEAGYDLRRWRTDQTDDPNETCTTEEMREANEGDEHTLALLADEKVAPTETMREPPAPMKVGDVHDDVMGAVLFCVDGSLDAAADFLTAGVIYGAVPVEPGEAISEAVVRFVRGWVKP